TRFRRRADRFFLTEQAGRTLPLVLTDQVGTIRSWSRGAAELYGLTESEAIGARWAAVTGEDALPEELSNDQVPIQRYETVHRTKDGELVPVMVTRTELGAPEEGGGSMIMVVDLTASKVLEGRLRRRFAQQTVLREIGEALQSAVELEETLRRVLVGATAGQGLRFNRAFLLLVDEAAGELRGRLAIGPSDPEEAHRIWSALARTNPSLKNLLHRYQPVVEPDSARVNEIVHRLSASLTDPDGFLVRCLRGRRTVRVVDGIEAGEQTPVEPSLLDLLEVRSFVAVPLRTEMNPVGLLLADNAITSRPIEEEDVEDLELLAIQAGLAIERARLIDELKHNQEKMLHSERLTVIGQMAARVAHEIRNPLVAIGGFARSLLRDAAPTDAHRESLEIIAGEVRRLETIVREVLDFTKPSPPDLRPVDLRRVAAELLELMRMEIDEAEVAASVEAPDDLPPALADRDRIFQALVNVVRNALHAMPGGGRLTLRLSAPDDRVEFAVEDTGVGMPPEVVARVGEPFFTTKSAGSGLGLTIAAQIVRDHGGEIAVESAVGQGTTMRIRLSRAL
ncbi:MAG TPA: ATP-binding protein, partial [Candidatus Polarisedimenticolaceae bacterium]|nr:ATP-binding protein [Candidatus Polarisedimenticolaceae bacterium]